MGKKTGTGGEKSRYCFGTGLTECLNPEVCICLDCKAWRANKNGADVYNHIKDRLEKKDK